MSHAYFLFGKAGSGKGTQAQKLKEHLESMRRSVIYIETGQLFRDFVAHGDTFASERTGMILNSGGLMPAFFPIYLWSQQLIETYDGTQDIIFDGVARRIEEAPMIVSALQFFGINSVQVFHIHITDDVAHARLSIRGDRADDGTYSSVQKRLDWYATNVVPVMEYFQTQHIGIMTEIDGEPDIDGVWAQIETSLNNNS